MLDDLYKDLKRRMKKSVDKCDQELKGIRTGRASTVLLEEIKIEYYGTPTPLKQLATLSVPEPRMVLIQPWDKGIIKNIEKAIRDSGTGLSPTNDGNVIRVNFPPLTEERRRELVKIVRKIGEEYKIAIRNIRREGNDEVKEMEKEKLISEDEAKRALKEIQKITDEFIKAIDELIEKKEKEIMEF
ncbi:ribosome recycling factor [Thermosulfidibacter takaii ABI70S6]|uniref:Ribosome-recycling factor n=1 Tax=Thermosulfidibacter takaii (strain DSM 17441 / JCM 13301 / NBRC 103674 / ABI70S6) TaxID=1298851 RepID=A0A0S3QVS0_THET7|nr:ribosome recycling factor [Thermosulfidibacter takaii]BAT72425.1 ribosome recycling factor [Thermosulfidibacter takaii ABI70S6]